MPTILFLSKAFRLELAPLTECLRPLAAKRKWNLQVIGEIQSQKDIRTLLKFWSPQGCIIHNATSPELFDRKLFGDIPIVHIDLDPEWTHPDDLVVRHDSAAAGRLAAHELLSLGFDHFAYARAEQRLFWCNERFEAFRDTLALHRKQCFVSENFNPNISSNIKPLREWIASLPQPIGLFTSNDGVGAMALSAIQELGLNVPADIAVISVDNCIDRCEHARPTLSSIQPDFASVGRIATDMLARKFANPGLPGMVLHYGQVGIVRRQSTRRFTGKDSRINNVLETIRLQAGNRDFSYKALADRENCTLRCLELRFRHVTGHTLRDELHERRIELAKQLIRQSQLTITEIASRCGFRSFATFSRVFTKLVGQSPRKLKNTSFYRILAEQNM